MTTLRRLLVLALMLPFISGAVVQAQTVAGAPATIDYQGKALDPAGNPLANTTPINYEMWFRIYDAQEGGATIWAEKQTVTVSRGLFSVRLGEGNTLNSEPRPSLAEAFNTASRFLGVTIVITGQATTEITPRLAFLATPFAYVATKSVSAERLILNSSTSAAPSSVNLSQVSHTVTTASVNTTLTDQFHTWGVASTASASTTITLPGVTSRREYYIFKTDSNTYPVLVSAPSGGTINGLSASIKLKVQGEGVVIQNTDGNAWWIVSDTRDKTPVGTVISSGQNSSTPPPGYLLCNGTQYSRTDIRYSDLFSAIFTAWGAPDAANFRVPDLRGLFLRGVDSGINRDTERSLRGTLNPGGNSGDAVGSLQDDNLKSHSHTFTGTAGTTGADGDHNHGVNAGAGGARGLARQSRSGENNTMGGGVDVPGSGSEMDVYASPSAIPASGTHTHSFTPSGTLTSTGGVETRPKNVGVYYFIKY